MRYQFVLSKQKKDLIFNGFKIFMFILVLSCERSLTYEFSIRNESKESINIVLNNQELYSNSSGFNDGLFTCAHYNTIKKDNEILIIKEHPCCTIELQPNEDLSFVEIKVGSPKLNEYHPLWDYQSCVLEISSNGNVLDSSIWVNRYNWEIEKSESGYVKYVLHIN